MILSSVLVPLSLIGSLLPACGTPSFMLDGSLEEASCPVVYRVRDAGLGVGLKRIVVVGQGFTESDLDTYRCAAALLMEDVLSSPPFDQHPIEVFRLDLTIPDPTPFLADPAGQGLEQAAGCTDLPCTQYPAPFDSSHLDCTTLAAVFPDYAIGVAADVAPEGLAPAACLETGLETRYCAYPDFCELIWPSPNGFDLTVDLATTCVAGADMIVIIANTHLGQPAGAGLYDLSTNSFPLAVVSLYDLEQPFRWWHLAHELGHAFGLLDEKTTSGVANYQEKRNVISQSELDAGVAPGWATDCDPLLASPPYCEINVCPPTYPNPQPSVGLWEGAFYCGCSGGCPSHCEADCGGYFRAEEECRMKRHQDPFCAACEREIREFFVAKMVFDPAGALSIRRFFDNLPKMEFMARQGTVPWLFDNKPLDLGTPGLARSLAKVMTSPVGRFVATVDLRGTRARIDIDSMRVAVEGPARGVTRELVVRRNPARAWDYLEWSLDGTTITPTAVVMENALPSIIDAKPVGDLMVTPSAGAGGEIEALGVDMFMIKPRYGGD
jgi:hypothetical protein